MSAVISSSSRRRRRFTFRSFTLATANDGLARSIGGRICSESTCCSGVWLAFVRSSVVRSFRRFAVQRVRSEPQSGAERPRSEEQGPEQADRLCQGRRRPDHGRQAPREPVHSGEGLRPRSRFTRADQVYALPLMQDIKRRYPTVLDVGSGPGFLAKHVDPEITQKMILVDSSRKASTPFRSEVSRS